MKKVLAALVTLTMLFSLCSSFVVNAAPESPFLIPVEADTYVQQGTPTQNFGIRTYAVSLAASSVSREAFLRFDLSSAVGEDFVIDKAELGITTFRGSMPSGGGNQNFTVYRVEEDGWIEGNGDGTVVAQGLTWNNSRDFTLTELLTTTSRPTYDVPYYVDLTDTVKNELLTDNMLSLKLETIHRSASNTWGIQFYTKEADVADTLKPNLKITISTDPDKVAVEKDRAQLTVPNINDVTENFTLPKTGARGSSITWSSDNPAVTISDNGANWLAVVTTSEFVVPFELTATITSGSEMATKKFSGSTGAVTNIKARQDANALTMPEYTDDMVQINLPSVGSVAGSAITWSSSNENVISSSGVVKRPAFNDEIVRLTATIVDDENNTETRYFDYTVKALNYLLPLKDTYVYVSADGALSPNNYGADTKIQVMTTYRKGLITFDLSNAPEGVVKKATLKLTRNDSNINFIEFRHVANDDWVEGTKNAEPAEGDEICANNFHKVITPGEKVAECRTGGSGTNISYNVDITSIVQKEIAGDKKLTLMIEKIAKGIDGSYLDSNSSTYPTSFYSLNYPITAYGTEYRPHIIFEMTNDPDEISAIEAARAITLPEYTYGNLTLPLTGINNSTITWSSDHPEIISNSGEINPRDTDIPIKLTATVTVNGKSITSVFYVTVRNSSMPYTIKDVMMYNAQGNRITTPSESGAIKEVNVQKNKSADGGIVIVALYRGNVLLNVYSSNISNINIGENEFVELDGALPDDVSGLSYRIMVFDGFSNLKPLAYQK